MIDHVADGRLVVPTCDNDADGVYAAVDQETTTGKVLRKRTEKGLQCQISLLEERRQNLNAKLIRKSIEIEDLVFSVRY